MANNRNTRSGNITKFEIFSSMSTGLIDIRAGVTELNYYEDVLKNTITLTIQVTEAGIGGANKGIIDNLPIRGVEKAHIVFEDAEGRQRKFEDDNALYVNRVRNLTKGTQRDSYFIDFCSREFLANEQVRVCKRYDGKISDSVENILTKVTSGDVGLMVPKSKINKIDPTLIPYNFIGNEKKPLFTCTWLASKAIPEQAGKAGASAGFLFYQTHDGFNFRSIDQIFSESYKKTFIYTNTALKPDEYDGKILRYDINRDIDLHNNLLIGAYSNRTIFFDYYGMNYVVRNFTPEDQEGIETGGKFPIDSVADEFRLPVSRLMSRILDIGTLPPGKSSKEELENWKNKPDQPTFDAAQTMVQSLMRYNQLFTIQVKLTLGGSFDLQAGDLIYCDFPELSDSSYNSITGGIYMISSLAHEVTPKTCFTYVTLVRDSYGRKSF